MSAGSSAIGQVLATTEQALDQIAAQTNRQAEQLTAGTNLQVEQVAQARRQAIVALRSELMERASALAVRFEELLDMLERAEQQIADGSWANGANRAADGAALVRLRERQRITYSTDSPQQPTRRIVRPRPSAAAAEPRRSRWWQRWFRDAA